MWNLMSFRFMRLPGFQPDCFSRVRSKSPERAYRPVPLSQIRLYILSF